MNKVIFRKDRKNNEIIAILPKKTNNKTQKVTCYTMLDGEFETDYLDIIKQSTGASEKEYRGLLNNILFLYPNIKVSSGNGLKGSNKKRCF